MAWWGFAYVLGPNYNAGMEPDSHQRATRRSQGQDLSGTCTEKERGAHRGDGPALYTKPPEDRAPLDQAYSDAMRTIAPMYPDDADVAALVRRVADGPASVGPVGKDGTEKPWNAEIVAALETPTTRRSPESLPAHNHFYIHAVEASRNPIARRPVPICRATDGSRRRPPHAHAVAYLYPHRSSYHDGVLANQRSVTVDSGYAGPAMPRHYALAYFPHNIHFLSARHLLR